MPKQTMIDYMQGEKNDELYTPNYAIDPLLKHIRHLKGAKVWECTDYGKSNITSVLKDEGFNVIPTHINNFDFLKDTPDFDFDLIITNPPYTLKDEFIEKCYSYGKPFALLLPITSLEGIRRGGYLEKMVLS